MLKWKNYAEGSVASAARAVGGRYGALILSAHRDGFIYQARRVEKGGNYLTNFTALGDARTLAEAKALAQADHDRRLLGRPPSPGETHA